MSTRRKSLRVAVIQMTAGFDKLANRTQAEELLRQAGAEGAEVAVLPEYWTYLGDAPSRSNHAESIPGPSSDWLSAMAREMGMALIGGTFPEVSDTAEDRVYNTCLVHDSTGQLVARYRKQHLFDVNYGPVTSRESTYVAPGDGPTVVDLAGWRVGLSICYDVRFPELYRNLSAAGAQVLAIPSAFTEYTGKDHWHLLLRARAVENQCYVAAAASASRHRETLPCYGHSLVVDPWGVVIAEASGEGPSLVIADLDGDYLNAIRHRFPSLANRRLSAGGELDIAEEAVPVES